MDLYPGDEYKCLGIAGRGDRPLEGVRTTKKGDIFSSAMVKEVIYFKCQKWLI